MDQMRATSVAAMSPLVPSGAEGGLLTVAEVAKFLRVSEQTVRAWEKDGKIPALRFNGIVRFDRDALQAWIDDKSNQHDPEEADSAH